ncbi:MAG TPA: hypothetical protein VJ436_14370 [Anaerolineales bacterium]|nr:hypothetical protein [Anaerolineales bacterium]
MKAEGYAPTTISAALGLLASFYRWCDERRIDAEVQRHQNDERQRTGCGSRLPGRQKTRHAAPHMASRGGAGFNPAAGAQPKVNSRLGEEEEIN